MIKKRANKKFAGRIVNFTQGPSYIKNTCFIQVWISKYSYTARTADFETVADTTDHFPTVLYYTRTALKENWLKYVQNKRVFW